MGKLQAMLSDLESLTDGSGTSHGTIDSLSKDIKALMPQWSTLMEFLKPTPMNFECVAWVKLPSSRVVYATLKRSSVCELTIRSILDGVEIQPYDVVQLAKVPEIPT